MNTIITVVIVGVIVLAVGLILAGMRAPRQAQEDSLAARLAEISQRGDLVSLEEIELSQPFQDRVIYPLMRRLGEISARFTPQHLIETTTKKLELAGNPGRIDAATFLSLRFVGAGGFGGLMLLLFIFKPGEWSFQVRALIILGLALFG